MYNQFLLMYFANYIAFKAPLPYQPPALSTSQKSREALLLSTFNLASIPDIPVQQS